MSPLDAVVVPEDAVYLTAEEAAKLLRFPSIRAFYKFIESSPIGLTLPRMYRGRVLLFDRRVVDVWLRQSRRVHAGSIRKVGNEEKSRNLDGEQR